MPIKSNLTKSLERIENILTLGFGKLFMQDSYKEPIMSTVIVEQNEVKGYTIPSGKILYVSHENITSRAIINITIFFETGQNLKLAFPTEEGLAVYADIQSQLGATT